MKKGRRRAIVGVCNGAEARAIRGALRRDRRLRILRVLHAAPGYVANEPLLRGALHAMGHAVAADRLRRDLVWLEKKGLLKTATGGQGLLILELRERGADVALGLTHCPAVARPWPESEGNAHPV